MGNRPSTRQLLLLPSLFFLFFLYILFCAKQSDCISASLSAPGRVSASFLCSYPALVFLLLVVFFLEKKRGESNRNVSVLMGLQLPQALDVCPRPRPRLCRCPGPYFS